MGRNSWEEILTYAEWLRELHKAGSKSLCLTSASSVRLRTLRHPHRPRASLPAPGSAPHGSGVSQWQHLGPSALGEGSSLKNPPTPATRHLPLRGWGTVNCFLLARTGRRLCFCPVFSVRCARLCCAMCSSFFSRSREREMN